MVSIEDYCTKLYLYATLITKHMTITQQPNWKIAIGLPLSVFAACFLITCSSVFKSHQTVFSNVIFADLIITAPLVYFLAIRKSSVSKLTIIRISVAGLFIAGLLLNTPLLHFIKTWIYPGVEVLMIFLLGRKFYVANKATGETADFLSYCRTIMQKVTGHEKAGNIISSEIAVLYYAFLGRKDKNIDYRSTFTSYKENGILLVLGTLLSLFLIETTGVHFLLQLWNTTLAWILTALSFYTCLQLFAHMKAVKARPIKLGTDTLEIHNGLAGDTFILYENIAKFEVSNKRPADAIKIALIQGLENHNCIIYLKHPIQVTKIFGIKKTTNTVLFFVDKPKEFEMALEGKMG